MGILTFPSYEHFYEGQLPDLEQFAKIIPTELIVSIACHINARKHANPNSTEVDYEIFKSFLNEVPNETAIMLLTKYKVFYQSVSKDAKWVNLFPLENMLNLIEFTMRNYVPGSRKDYENTEDILKLILILNKSIEERQFEQFPKKEDEKDPLLICKLLWPTTLGSREFMYRKDPIIPAFKTQFLIEFLSNHPKYKPYLDSYMRTFGFFKPNEYIKNLFAFYQESYLKEQKAMATYFEQTFLDLFPVLKPLIREVNATNAADFKIPVSNFKLLREKPLFQMGDRIYISNWNFLIDKLGEGFKYDFFNRSGIKAILKGNDDIGKFNAFMNDLGEEFNEKILFRNITERYLKDPRTTLLYGDPGGTRNQDLYVRNNHHISLIEFKSVVFPIKATYEEIKAVIDEKMVDKAIVQLIKQIVKLDNNMNHFENLSGTGIKKEELCIYPVIVYTDDNWGMHVVNRYLQLKFRELLKSYDFKFFAINDLVLINLNFFMQFEKLFIEDKKLLHTIIYDYYQLIRGYWKIPYSPETPAHRFSPFEYYIASGNRRKETAPVNSTIFKEMSGKL